MACRGSTGRRGPRALGVACVMSLGLALHGSIIDDAQGAATSVREQAFGLPHIFADTDLEMARENGREIAKDRLAQIILLARVGRGTLYQAFGALDARILDDDIEARATGYTSSELNRMFERLPQRERDLILEYCKGVNDTIESIYAGELPEPMEVTILRSTIFALDHDLFGNAVNLSDQIDPWYRGPGEDPEHPLAGFQFTPELAVAVGVLEVRNFGVGGFNEVDLIDELQAFTLEHGVRDGSAMFRDLHFLNDPLAPASVPGSTLPGFGGPLAAASPPDPALEAGGGATEPVLVAHEEPADVARLRQLLRGLPRRAYREAMEARRARHEARARLATRLGAWPRLGSYAWAIAGNRSETGHPWIGGFPQTGIQTPSIMHFVENRSGEGIEAVGMEFPGAPLILIGHTDQVAYTTTTAQLPVVDSFFEVLIAEQADQLRYDDEGTPAALSMRSELIRGGLEDDVTPVFWRSHERAGNGGTRPVLEFLGDVGGTADGGSASELLDPGAFDSALVGGHVALIGGTGAGQIRLIAAVPDADTLEVDMAWTTPPDDTSVYVAGSGSDPIIAVAIDSTVWLEETTAVLGFSRYQRARSILDIRAGVRLIPSTHNFLAADNREWNGIGTESGNGNIGYWSTGFSRIRQNGLDRRLPLFGGNADPFAVVAGTVESATENGLTASGAFAGLTLSANAFNARYDDPEGLHPEPIVTITSGTGFKQTRRIASNTNDTLVLEEPWGVTPAPGDTFEVAEVIGMPETVNPSEGYTANWNNKAAAADPGRGFGRQHRVNFILERLAQDSSWNRDEQRQLNADLAGLPGSGAIGRYLLPRVRQAVDEIGDGGNPAVEAVLAQLEAHQAAPAYGRYFVDALNDDSRAGEIAFLESLANQLAQDIYGDEYEGVVGVPGGSRGLALVQHAIDAAAADVQGAYELEYRDDYFGGMDWRVVVRDAFSSLATAGIPEDGPRGSDRYIHPLAELDDQLIFPPTPAGNRGTWEQIVEVAPDVRGEFIFPLGQSGHIEGALGGVTDIALHTQTLHPIWRDWRFVPMLALSADIETGGSPDNDGDGVLDGYERWYFGDLSRDGEDDGDGDGLDLSDELATGADPTSADTDGDGLLDGDDPSPQDRLVPEPASAPLQLLALATLSCVARRRRDKTTPA